jgi:uncharacterized protein (TIGR02646 family)
MMRKLPDEVPPPEVQVALNAARDELERVGDYAAKVRATEHHWKSARTRVVKPVRSVLRSMCGEAEPCCYCESSIGAQVEHARPKSLYPELTFDWLNLLLVCGACNTIKNNGFAVLIDGRAVQVARRRSAPIVPPPTGPMALVDLRREDPLSFFELNLELGVIQPRRRLDELGLERAKFTRKLLNLNRDPLPTWRVQACGTFKARLEQYINRRARDPMHPALTAFKAELLRLPHQMVWREMKRQHATTGPDLRQLFADAPEALDW